MTRNIIVDLRSPSARSSLRCGNEGAWLARLISEGFRVPDGFVVTADAFCSTDPRTLEAAVSSKLDHHSTNPTDLWAVRSSPLTKDKYPTCARNAERSQTRLGVGTADVAPTIRQVWSSTVPQSQLRDGSGPEASTAPVAVIVQRLLRPSAAGLCYTVDSMGHGNRMFVYANYGLGQSIAVGALVPDTHIVARDTLESVMDIQGSKTTQIVQCSCGLAETGVPADEQKRFCLSPAEVTAVANLAKSVEARMGEPVRVAWAFEEGTLYLVDARRISE